jgi:chromosome segregation ATPase
MKSNLLLTTLISITFTLPLAAQGRGQGGGGGAQRGGGQPAPSGQPTPSGQRGPSDAGQRGQQSGAGQQQTREERIRATEQQRSQYETCTQSGNRVSDRARTMAQAAKSGGANKAEFQRLHEQLQQEIRTMQQDRDRFMNSLSQQQRTELQDRIRKMDQARDRLNDRTRLLDSEMAKPDPDQKRIRSYAQDVEKATKEYQKQLAETAREMGVEA